MFSGSCDVAFGTHYQCPNDDPYVPGANCLNIHSLCDGIRDCRDGWDENVANCSAYCTGDCENLPDLHERILIFVVFR